MRKRSLLFLAIVLLVPCLAIAQTLSIFPQAQYNNLSLLQSPTNAITSAFFYEPADNYMNPLGFGNITDPVFLLKLKTPTGSSAPGDPYEIGMGSKFGALYGAAYYGFDAATIGLLGGDQSVSQTQDDSLIVDATNAIVGKTTDTFKVVHYLKTSLNAPALLAGFKLGSIQIGVGDLFYSLDQTEFATFDPSMSLNASSATKVTNNAGTITSLDSTEYAVGKWANTRIGNKLSAGLTMPLGTMTLKGGLIIDLVSQDFSSNYGAETMRTLAGNGYASYTPPAALPDASASAIADLRSWDIDLGNDIDASFDVMPTLNAAVEIPFDFMGNAAVFTPGITYNLDLTTRSAKLYDETGAAFTVAGTGFYQNTASYLAQQSIVTGFTTVTTQNMHLYTAKTYSKDSSSSVGIPLVLKIEPNAGFRFGISVTPSISFGSEAYTQTGKSTTTTVVDNGNGIAAATDPGDTTTIDSVVDQPFSVTTNTFGLTMNFGTGVQIYLKPDKFRLNLGAQAITKIIDRSETTTDYTGLSTTTTTQTIAGVTTTTAASATTTGGNEFTNLVTDAGVNTDIWYVAGVTYFLNPNVMFDFYAKNANAFNLAATTDNGGFFNLNNYTIQLTIKLPPQK